MERVTNAVAISTEIHDSWTELLAGTRYLLDAIEEENTGNIEKVNLARLTLISAYQMIEVMFFHQLSEQIKNGNSALFKAFKYDLDDKISFAIARNKWPEIIIGKKLKLGDEPLQSMKKLGELRNSAIHHTATEPIKDIGESALFTAIESSKTMYEFFTEDSWDDSDYYAFTQSYPSKSCTFLYKVLADTKNPTRNNPGRA